MGGHEHKNKGVRPLARCTPKTYCLPQFYCNPHQSIDRAPGFVGADPLRPVGATDPVLAPEGRMMTGDIGRIRKALQFIPASDRDTWVKMDMAIMRYAYIRCAA